MENRKKLSFSGLLATLGIGLVIKVEELGLGVFVEGETGDGDLGEDGSAGDELLDNVEDMERFRIQPLSLRERNRPERYDRNLAENTLKAMEKIVKIRGGRESEHIRKRWKGKKNKEQKEAQKELEQGIHLVKAPARLQPESSLTLPKIMVSVRQQQTEQNQATEE